MRKGRKKPTPLKQQPRQSSASTRGNRDQRNTGIIGTGTESSIPVITTKRVSVFATRFSPDVDADTLKDYLVEKLANTSVTCRRIETASSRFGSFHVTADCKEVADMFSPHVWPAGVYVRRYYEPRVSRVSAGVALERVEEPRPVNNVAVAISL